jgi:hypothetical protein
MTRPLPRYIIEYKKGKETATTEPNAVTQVRLAIRMGRNGLRCFSSGTQLTVRGWQPGDTSKRGRVEYQAHLSKDGKIIVAEER